MVCTERRGLRSRATAGACLVVWAAAVTMLGGAGGANAFVPLPAPECLLPGSWGQTWQIASVASPLELLLSSAVSGGYMQLATMLTSIVDANSALPGMAGRTALHGAAAGGNAAAVLGLVQRGGADSNVRDDLGRAPLHYAVHAQLEMAASLGNETDVVAALLSTGCDPNAEDSDGRTPLHWAANKGDRASLVQGLVNAGATLDKKDKTGRTALQYAAEQEHLDVISTLVRAGATDLQDGQHVSMLLKAVLEGRTSVVEAAAKAGMDLNTRDKNGWRAIHYVASDGNAMMVRTLAELGANVNVFTNDGDTALNKAASNCDLETVKMLLDVGARPEQRLGNGWTAAMSAGQLKCEEVVMEIDPEEAERQKAHQELQELQKKEQEEKRKDQEKRAYKLMFEHVDEDDSGTLSSDEFVTYVKGFLAEDYDMPEETIEETLDDVDEDVDGEITEEEFTAWLKRSMQGQSNLAHARGVKDEFDEFGLAQNVEESILSED